MKKKVPKKVKEWLAYDDAVVMEVLGNKAIRVICEGEETLTTKVQDFILYTISDVPSRKIARIVTENGRDLDETDTVEVEIEDTIAEKYGL